MIAKNSRDLQELIDILAISLEAVGLSINISKSFMLCWVKDSKKKKLIFDSKSTITVKNRPIATLQVNDNFVVSSVRN